MKYSWEEIKKHNKREDAWVVINGEIFDVTLFIKEHTGGCMPLFAAGKDVTHLFRTIHSPKADNIILSNDFRKKYYIGRVKNYKSEECDYFKPIKIKIWNKLKSLGISAKNKKNTTIVIKTFVFIIIYSLLYYFLMTKNNKWNSFLYYGCVLLFGFFWGVLILAQHEFSHFYTNRSLNIFNKLLINLLPILTGASNEQFAILHAIDHHQTVGDSFETEFINKLKASFRIYKNDPCHRFTKYQHIYAYFYLPFFSIISIIVDNIIIIQNIQKIPIENIIILFIQKILFVCLIFIIPFYILGKKWILPLTIILIIVSISIFIFEYYNHSDEQTVNKNNNKKMCWNNRIINTTVNWDKFPIRNFFTFGLDKHVEHHFFPALTSNNINYVTPFLKNNKIRIGNIKERHKMFYELLKKRAKECPFIK